MTEKFLGEQCPLDCSETVMHAHLWKDIVLENPRPAVYVCDDHHMLSPDHLIGTQQVTKCFKPNRVHLATLTQSIFTSATDPVDLQSAEELIARPSTPDENLAVLEALKVEGLTLEVWITARPKPEDRYNQHSVVCSLEGCLYSRRHQHMWKDLALGLYSFGECTHSSDSFSSIHRVGSDRATSCLLPRNLKMCELKHTRFYNDALIMGDLHKLNDRTLISNVLKCGDTTLDLWAVGGNHD